MNQIGSTRVLYVVGGTRTYRIGSRDDFFMFTFDEHKAISHYDWRKYDNG
jgi:hypothetical protein